MRDLERRCINGFNRTGSKTFGSCLIHTREVIVVVVVCRLVVRLRSVELAVVGVFCTSGWDRGGRSWEVVWNVVCRMHKFSSNLLSHYDPLPFLMLAQENVHGCRPKSSDLTIGKLLISIYNLFIVHLSLYITGHLLVYPPNLLFSA